MLLAFTVVLLVVAFGILVSVYSIFFPFFENLKNISQYNSAYYAAISSVERGALVLRYKKPGFQGSGGFVGGSSFGPKSDNNSDFLALAGPGNGMWWNIDSRTQTIPKPGLGNVDYMLADADSLDYNVLDYSRVENFIMDVDNTTNPDHYYSKTGVIKYFVGNADSFSGIFRLPPKVFLSFSGGFESGNLLCDDVDNPLCDLDGDKLFDEPILNWSIKGMYKGSSFNILPRFSENHNANPVLISYDFDSMMRESLFDDGVARFTTNHSFAFSPVENGIAIQSQIGHNMFGRYASSLKATEYQYLFPATSEISGWMLRFSLMDLLRTRNENIYPFLEYKFEFQNDVSERFYSIDGIGRVGDYDVRINVLKPTSKESAIGSFTIIF